VLNGGVVMEENAISESAKSDEMRYVANCYAGIIQFPVQKSGTDVASNIKISVWEYIGKTLTNVLKDIGTVESVIKYEVADSCPPASEEYKGYIYFIPSPTSNDKNVYDELICVHDGNEWKWEQIGSTAINQETHEEWHNKNDYKHIELYNTENVSTSQDQNESGVSNCYGFIFDTPYMLKLEKFLIHGFYSSGFGSGGNTNFDDLYIKIIDIKSGHVLAVSDNATVHGTSGRPGSA
jgi:hypothetical protein